MIGMVWRSCWRNGEIVAEKKYERINVGGEGYGKTSMSRQTFNTYLIWAQTMQN